MRTIGIGLVDRGYGFQRRTQGPLNLRRRDGGRIALRLAAFVQLLGWQRHEERPASAVNHRHKRSHRSTRRLGGRFLYGNDGWGPS